MGHGHSFSEVRWSNWQKKARDCFRTRALWRTLCAQRCAQPTGTPGRVRRLIPVDRWSWPHGLPNDCARRRWLRQRPSEENRRMSIGWRVDRNCGGGVSWVSAQPQNCSNDKRNIILSKWYLSELTRDYFFCRSGATPTCERSHRAWASVGLGAGLAGVAAALGCVVAGVSTSPSRSSRRVRARCGWRR
jgi:hypothetical protein